MEIPPLIFLPFVENCFKHGVKKEGDIKVNIDFAVRDKFLYFSVENPLDGHTDSGPKHGIGIENVKRRLDLLYGKKYSLETSTADGMFKVFLKLPL